MWKKLKLFQTFIHKSDYLNSKIKVLITYRYLFFLIFAVFIWIDFHVYTGRSLVGLYSIIMVFSGLVFKPVWQGILQSILVTIIRYVVAPDGLPFEIEVIFFQWISYFAIWYAISALVRNSIEQKENLVRMTTALANSIDKRDKYTAFHSSNVARYAELISKEMGFDQKFCSEIKLAAQLHDLGKIGIPERILNKSGRLTQEEYEIIKTHPMIGYDIVKHIKIFSNNGILDAILYHHEREDGSGYPSGLEGQEIPIKAKIIAVADSFDAMTSNRRYRENNSFSFAVKEILRCRGTHYDPAVVDSFIQVIDRKGTDILNVKIISDQG